MKVAVVHNHHSRDIPSGEDVAVGAEVEALRRAGIEVDLCAVHNDDMAASATHKARAAWSVATGRGVEPAIGRDVDLVHVHNLFPYFGTRWLTEVRVPVVSTQHSYRPMCANGCLFRDGRVCTLCLDGHRWAGTRHGCYGDSALASLPLSIAGRRGAAHDPIIERSDVVLVLSERSRSLYRRAGVDDDRLRLDAHFIPDPLVRAPSDGGGDHWLFAGRLSIDKGAERLVERWPRDVPLRIIGDGPSREVVGAATTGSRIEVLGPMSRDAVVDEMRRARGLVVPSLWYETFGLVYIEALSVGLPVLAFRPNVIADAVVRDGTGIVGDWDDVDGTVARAAALVPGLRRHCREVFEATFSEAAFVERRLALYRSLL